MNTKNYKSHKMISFKLILVGEAGVGKSSLMYHFIKQGNEVIEKKTTVGVQFGSKILKFEQQKVKLEIWDTAGQEKYRAIVRNFYRNTSAVFLVYNVCDKRTFIEVERWMKQARQNSRKSALTILVGTHIDLQDMRQVNKEQAEQYKFTNNIDFFMETSSKSGEGVFNIFEQTAKLLLQSHLKVKSQIMHKNDQDPTSQYLEDLDLEHPTCWTKPKGCCH